MKRIALNILAATLTLWTAACLAVEPAKPVGALVDFSIDASRTAHNDLARATAFAEVTETTPGEAARKVNSAIAQALAMAKAYAAVKTRSGSTWTFPSYAKNGRGIDSWRVHSELQFESRDVAALSELLGKLQAANLGVGQIGLAPAPETRKKAEDEAMREAIAAFQEKAQRIAALLGKSYRIKQMNIGGSGPAPMFAMARRATSLEAAPMPIEAGESTVTINISGQIELTE